MIINKRNIISKPSLYGNMRRSLYIKMNQIKWRRKSIKLRLKGKVINFTSLHLMQLEISQVCKFPKAYVDTKNLKREDET